MPLNPLANIFQPPPTFDPSPPPTTPATLERMSPQHWRAQRCERLRQAGIHLSLVPRASTSGSNGDDDKPEEEHDGEKEEEEHVIVPVEFSTLPLATRTQHSYFLAAREQLSRYIRAHISSPSETVAVPRLSSRMGWYMGLESDSGSVDESEDEAEAEYEYEYEYEFKSELESDLGWKQLASSSEGPAVEGKLSKRGSSEGEDDKVESLGNGHGSVTRSQSIDESGYDADINSLSSSDIDESFWSCSDSDDDEPGDKKEQGYDAFEDFTARIEFVLNLSADPVYLAEDELALEPVEVLRRLRAYVDRIIDVIETSGSKGVPLPYSAAPALVAARIVKGAQFLEDDVDGDDDDEDAEWTDEDDERSYGESEEYYSSAQVMLMDLDPDSADENSGDEDADNDPQIYREDDVVPLDEEFAGPVQAHRDVESDPAFKFWMGWA
ncbi:uncharacterized protein BO97DRAFT_420387 [Aspergillus homomorphus CBS 101889]|uniref:Uncharacterized protein n=1 Tax=Aspergillus homomorphus (strain CBS 101889) TaxID=1450537 RepID=A0A395I9V2_ASPHC|nr:hypothetical protein BO97DRAFT_420387 [Aspergillus homomorphus CBS 101889]RAL17002.1 hypothetical protein BO97DRAFT_420387 [Aspergillus homomorphus CBS 101889]